MLQYQHNRPRIPQKIILSSHELMKHRIFLTAKLAHGKKELGAEPGFCSFPFPKKATTDRRRAVRETLQNAGVHPLRVQWRASR
jgi:hypothetical protein